jgi:4-alpha-glucanotransferase
MDKCVYQLWVQRFASALELVDLLRVDHFRGFVKFWSVPAGHATARQGRWITGPGIKLFNRIHKRLGHLPLIAENLGVITPAVEKLRSEIGLPGMVVLQFGFGEGGTHRPNNYDRNLVCFTGTHDNNTTRGWWEELTRAANENPLSAANAELNRVKAYFRCDGRSIAWRFVQAAMTSIADISILPMQDVLELGCAGRMNVPGRAKGNWNWRYDEKAITPGLTCRLRSLAEVSWR